VGFAASALFQRPCLYVFDNALRVLSSNVSALVVRQTLAFNVVQFIDELDHLFVRAWCNGLSFYELRLTCVQQ